MMHSIDPGRPIPLRFLGFGLFWAWLFLVGTSPSMLLGHLTCPGNIPLEMAELAARSLVLLYVLAASPRILSTRRGLSCLAGAAALTGTCAAPVLLAFGSAPAGCLVGAILAGITDVGLFLTWLSLFGYMRLGDALAMLVMSYAAGSALFLSLCALGHTAMALFATILPVASCAAFLLAARQHAEDSGHGGLLAKPAQGPQTPDEPQMHVADPLKGPASAASLPLSRSLARMTACLAVYAAIFSLHSTATFAADAAGGVSFAVEPLCMLALSAIYLLICACGKKDSGPYVLYRVCAPLMGLGAMLGAAGLGGPCAFAPVALGYLMFEVLALNDYCNIVHATRNSLLRSMTRARLAISLGMLAGWCAGYVLPQSSLGTASAVSGFAVLLASTQLFSDRDVATVTAVADDRSMLEASDYKMGRASALETYAVAIRLTPREAEVLGLLVEGRTTSYIASKLFIAESTARAHVHSIYQKACVSSRMELLDAFERHWERSGARQTA